MSEMLIDKEHNLSCVIANQLKTNVSNQYLSVKDITSMTQANSILAQNQTFPKFVS